MRFRGNIREYRRLAANRLIIDGNDSSLIHPCDADFIPRRGHILSMPLIPEEKFRPTREQVIIDLLKSIAMEENAIAHLMHAEADKIKAVLGQSGKRVDMSRADLIKLGNQAAKLMDVIVMKEWLLLRKLENVMELGGQWDEDDEDEE